MNPFQPPLAVISPHLDDGVFGCGDLLASSHPAALITVFAGAPDSYAELRPWDESAGFARGDDVLAARRDEDAAALRTLAATPVWLEFRDAQYAQSPGRCLIATALETALAETNARSVVAPLGLFHSDHRLASDAAIQIALRDSSRTWYLYADAIYRTFNNELDPRLRGINNAGLHCIPLAGGSAASMLKRRAIDCYASQLRALALPGHPGFDDVFEPERYWRIERAP